MDVQNVMAKTPFQLSPEQVSRIVGFIGYGNTCAPVWFIGLEEGLGNMDSDDTDRNLIARGRFDETTDLYKAHLQLRAGGHPIDVEKNPPTTQVWRWMAKIMRARRGESDWSEKKSAKNYVRLNLGRSEGGTFLTELSPIPAHNTVGGKKWHGWFMHLDPELISHLSQRQERLGQMLRQSSPHLVVCYGRGSADKFAQLLDVDWQPVSPKISKSPDSRCLLLPFFGQGHMSHDVVRDLFDRGLLRSAQG